MWIRQGSEIRAMSAERAMSTRILLIRHGETDDNKKGIFQGQAGRGLNAEGRTQSARLAARLGSGGMKLDALYCSDLERAAETAAILGEALSLTPEADPALRELNLGAWQGLSLEEAGRRFPEELAAWRRGEDVRRGGGETVAELAARVRGAIDRIAARHEGQAVAVVSHGAALKAFMASVLGMGLLHMRVFSTAANTAVSLVEQASAGSYRLVVWNDSAHLCDPWIRTHATERAI